MISYQIITGCSDGVTKNQHCYLKRLDLNIIFFAPIFILSRNKTTLSPNPKTPKSETNTSNASTQKTQLQTQKIIHKLLGKWGSINVFLLDLPKPAVNTWQPQFVTTSDKLSCSSQTIDLYHISLGLQDICDPILGYICIFLELISRVKTMQGVPENTFSAKPKWMAISGRQK